MNKLEEKTNGRCAYCGVSIVGTSTIDHIIPKSIFDYRVFYKIGVPLFLSHLDIGQSEHEDNLFAACKFCNEHKGDLDIESFRRSIAASVKRLCKKNREYMIAKKFGLVKELSIPNIEFYFETISKFSNTKTHAKNTRPNHSGG